MSCAECVHFDSTNVTCNSPDKRHGEYLLPIKMKTGAGKCNLLTTTLNKNRRTK